MALTQVYDPMLTNTGVGTNAPPIEQQTQTLQQQEGQVLGAIGSGIDTVGNALGNILPDWNISENLERLGGMLNPSPVQATDGGDLVQALVNQGGYSQIDAQNAASGPNADALRNEFLSGGTTAPTPTTYNIRGTDVTANSPTEAAEQAVPGTDFGQFATEFNNDPTAFFNQIDQDAASQLAFLDRSQSALDEARAAYDKLIASDYQTNLAKGTASKESAVGKLGQNQVQAEQRKQDALNASKQLYSQLAQGYQQRFGGRSSASDASRAILGQEQQRQEGKTGRDYMNTVAQIEGQKADVENQYNTLVQDLDTQKQRAQYDALQNYQTNMRSIDSDRTQTESAKSQAKMQVLMNLRDQQNQIAMNDRQYRQQLDAMKQQTQLQLNASLQQMQQQAQLNTQAGQGSLNTFIQGTGQTSTDLGQGNTTRTASTLSDPNTLSRATGQVSQAPQTTDEWWAQQNAGL